MRRSRGCGDRGGVSVGERRSHAGGYEKAMASFADAAAFGPRQTPDGVTSVPTADKVPDLARRGRPD